MMPFDTRAVGRYTVVAWHGEIDLHHAPAARRQILALVDAGRSLVIDLAGVTYLDSAGVAVLAEGRRRAQRRGQDFVLTAVSAAAMKLLTFTRLDTVFPMYGSAEDFLRHAAEG